MAGSLAPNPQDFPFTEQGRRDYYAAVSSSAQQMMAQQQQQQMMHMHAAHAARINREAEHQRHREVEFLLLSP